MYGHDGHLSHVTIAYCINFGLLIIRSLHMKLSSIGPMVFEKTMF